MTLEDSSRMRPGTSGAPRASSGRFKRGEQTDAERVQTHSACSAAVSWPLGERHSRRPGADRKYPLQRNSRHRRTYRRAGAAPWKSQQQRRTGAAESCGHPENGTAIDPGCYLAISQGLWPREASVLNFIVHPGSTAFPAALSMQSLLQVEDAPKAISEADPTPFLLSTLATVGSVLLWCHLFLVSLDLMSLAFRLFPGRPTANAIVSREVIKIPVVDVLTGLLLTVLVQSSSSSTSTAITLVGSQRGKSW